MFNLFKLIHIVAAMVWIGGAFALIVLNTRMARSNNRGAMEAMAEQAAFYGRAVLGPAAGITLLAGIVTAILMGVSFTALWILWGLAGIVGSMIIGAVFISRTAVELTRAAAGPDRAGLPALQRRIATLNLVNLLLLFSVVAAMVFKPTI